ncbi:MAG: DUF2306 domain-containing protein [Thermoanaerobaculia bacterium]
MSELSTGPVASRCIRARTAAWATIALLAFFGFVASVGRGWSVLESVVLLDGPAPELSRLDEANIEILKRAFGLEKGSTVETDLDEQNRRFLAKFNRHPVATLLHVVPAALFMILIPLQFSAAIRRRAIGWHRWAGRLIVVCTIPIGLSAFFFGLLMPFSGRLESAAIALFGTLFLFAVVRGFLAIRRRDIRAHREWMIRMAAVGLGVSLVRLAGIVLAILTMEGPAVWFAASNWIGFTLAVVAAELWIRRTRAAPVTRLAAAPAMKSPAPA